MKLQMKKGSAGFTLMEILIVIIVLGVLAGLAAPIFTQTKGKAVKAEAVQSLNAVRQSQIRYFAEFSDFADAFSKMDFDPSAGQNGVVPKFTYAAPVITGTAGAADRNFTVTATCAVADCNGKTVKVDKTGILTTGTL